MSGLITSAGKNQMLYRLIGTSKTVPSVFKVGTGTTAPAATDTDLETAVVISGVSYTKAFASGYPTVMEASKTLTTRCVLASTEANSNTLTEFSIFNTDGTPLMFSRDTYTGIVKNAYIQVIYESVEEMV